ncbi:MAG: magnesium transporter [Elusimicrobiota bacterium]
MEKLALYIPEIRQAIKNKNFEDLKRILKVQPVVDIARGWESLSNTEKQVVFDNIEFSKKVELFERLNFKQQKFLVKKFKTGQIIPVLNRMASDERVDFFDKLSSRRSKKFFDLMEESEVKNVKELMAYGVETAGGKMTTEFVKLNPKMSARDALLKLNSNLSSKKVRNIYALYVVDGKDNLTGGLSLQRLVTADPDKSIEQLAKPVDSIQVYADQDQEEVARLFTHYDLLSVPVVSKRGKLLGVITIDDIVDVIHQETEEDIAMMSGVDPDDFKKSSLAGTLKTRLPWLFLAYLGGLAASGVIGRYEATLESVVALAAFIPVIMHMGGTVGVQSSTVMVRGFALGKINSGRIGKILLKEFGIGLILSAGYAVLLGLLSWLRYGALESASKIGIVTGSSIGLVMVLGATIGVCLPFVFKKFGIDPAVATGPVITPVIDIAGLGIYFAIASAVLL